MGWAIWIVVGLIALAGEAITTSLILGSFAVAALLVAPLSLVAPLTAQVVAFGALSLVLLGVARPAILRLLPRGESETVQPRVGPGEQLALAVSTIDQRQGQIRVGSGEFWTARSTDAAVTIEQGCEVEIVRMDGLVARVKPYESSLQGSDRAIESLEAAEEPAGSAAAVPFGLSGREVEVMRLVALGMSNQQIAERLFLSPRTVHHHVSHILDKMGASNRVEAARMAMERGLVKPGERLE